MKIMWTRDLDEIREPAVFRAGDGDNAPWPKPPKPTPSAMFWLGEDGVWSVTQADAK